MAARKRPPRRAGSGPGDPHRVEPEALRWRCDPSVFPFETTAELDDVPISIIGQPRALESLRIGFAVRGDGYNVFVAGEVGTGRSTAVRHVLAQFDRGGPTPEDLVFVHNFKDPDRPHLLRFPTGRGSAFAKAMDDLVEALRKNVPTVFETDSYRNRRNDTIEKAKAAHREKVKSFEKRIEEAGFAMVQIQVGPFVKPEITPVVAGNPVQMEQLETLVEEGRFAKKDLEKLKVSQAKLSTEFEALTKEFRKIELDVRQQILDLDRAAARSVVADLVDDLWQAFDDKEVRAWLEEVREDVLDHLERFREREEPVAGAERDQAKAEWEERLRPYKVNVLVDHTETKGRPILWETNPSYRNLFGSIDGARTVGGEWKTDHTRIKAGALARASGGFLVLDALDVLVEPGVWPALKRTLRHRTLEIHPLELMNVFASVSLKPEPIPLDIKLVLVGTRHIYRLLYELDEDFKKIFKVKAELALEVDESDEELLNLARFVRKKCKDDGLLPFRREAVAALAEHSVRLAGRQGKLSTRFKDVADAIREAGYWAAQGGAAQIGAEHVAHAVARRKYRLDLVEEILLERIAEGTVLVDVDGATTGQVNGLVVLDVGDHTFGLPSRITASIGMGRAGIIDIEREAELAGPIHTKGVLILAGFLRSRFAQDKPLALSASVVFEQSYGGVEGDSASCAELFALLSALSGVPIRQAVAVTGSVNQKGEVQPIGGVNEKIEGYFALCRARGLTGEQGVVIPARNLPHLMLDLAVVDAVREGKFHVWAVSTVEEGIEILTGVPAGDRGPSGLYPPDSIFGRVDRRLGELAEAIKEFGPLEG